MAQDEEVAAELEAVQAVYGDDCRVIQRFPPNLHVHLKPRTADDSSQQFVEALLGLCADPLEAVELLTNMNHPDGNCPLCLYPLVKEDATGDFLPFMKLMSCFHCFHCKCFIRWWNWLQGQQGNDLHYSSNGIVALSSNLQSQLDLPGAVKENCGSCPVCRKVFQVKDVEHVLAFIENFTSQLSLDGTESEDDDEIILQSEAENIRKQKFEALTKLQEDTNGLIENKRHEVLVPGMFLPEPVRPPAAASVEATSEQQQAEPSCPSTSEAGPSRLLPKPGNCECRNSGMRKDRFRHRSKPKTNKSKR